MADNNFRNDRGSDPPAWDESRQAASDPLAELARLIGQGDAYPEADRRDDYRDDHNARRPREAAPAPSLDWAAEDRYAAHDSRADDRYAPPSAPSHQSYAPQERGYENGEPASEGGRYFSGPAATFNGFGDETDAYDRDEQSMAMPAQTAPDRALATHHDNDPHDEYEGDPEYQGGEGYAADDYYDEAPAPRRRNGLLVIMAVLALTVVGTAGAFGYRAMFGGSVLPTLPPIIKAGNGPNKIVPAYGDSQANNATQSGAASSGSAENLLSREEQPVNIEPAKAPRVVATIPIAGQGSLPPGAGAAVADAAAQNFPVPPAPSPPAPAPAAAAAPAPVAPPAPAPAAEPKKIHTVTIKADQVGAPAALAAPPAARTQAHQAAPKPGAAATSSAGSSGPMSLVPGSSGGAAAAAPPPQPTRVATAPVAVASAGSVSGASAGGGYAVQITSQRSAAEAQASFRELRAKFPNQLGGREPIIRRADLGEKGTFYRALVGPFTSTEQAAELCSGLKAAGGSCIVQRN
jgi:SPOR domain